MGIYRETNSGIMAALPRYRIVYTECIAAICLLILHFYCLFST